MLSIVDDSSLTCSVSTSSDKLRRSSQTATGNPAKTSSTSTMVMESLLAKYSLTLSLQAATRPGAVGESYSGSAGWDALATISASLSSFFGVIAVGRHASVPIPQFASSCGTLSCELRNQKGLCRRRSAYGSGLTRHEAKPAPTSVCG